MDRIPVAAAWIRMIQVVIPAAAKAANETASARSGGIRSEIW